MMQDDEFILKLKLGDSAAFQTVFEHYSDKVYRLALGLLKNEFEADGVVQDTFMRLIEKIDQFEGRASIGTWLYRVAYNICQDRLRKRGRTELLDPFEVEDAPFMPQQFVDWSHAPQRCYDEKRLTALIQRGIDKLPERLKAVFILREIEGLNTQATAEVLDLSASNVKVRLHRARLLLRETLSAEFGELVRENK